MSLLPDWIEWLSNAQPFTSTVDLLRNLLVATDLRESATVPMIKIVGFAIVLLPTSLLLLHRGMRLGQRRGTIIEY